jgi:hypothetical protein
MKKHLFTVLALICAAATAHAAAPALNFDGPGNGGAVKELGAPGAEKWGDIPPVPPPTPVDPPGGNYPQPPQDPKPPKPPKPPQNPGPVQPPAPGTPWVPPPSAVFNQRPFPAMACVAMGLGSTDCVNGSGAQIAVKLAMNMREDILQEAGKKAVVFVFPPAAGPAEVYSALRTALTYGIDQLAIGMQADISNMMREMDSNGWGTPYDKAKMMRMIIEDERQIRIFKAAALKEAAAGSNWKKSGKNGYKFVGGPAYDQLSDSLLLKEIFTGQKRFSPDAFPN